MTELVVAPKADDDMREILDFLEREAGRQTAERYAVEFRRTIARLVEHRRSGPRRRALGRDARIAVVFPFILIYDYAAPSDMLSVLRVVHGRRDIGPHLLRMP